MSAAQGASTLRIEVLPASAAILMRAWRKERPFLAPLGEPARRRRVLTFLSLAAILAIGLRGARTGIRAWLQNAYEPRFHPEPVAVDGDCVYMMPTTPVCASAGRPLTSPYRRAPRSY